MSKYVYSNTIFSESVHENGENLLQVSLFLDSRSLKYLRQQEMLQCRLFCNAFDFGDNWDDVPLKTEKSVALKIWRIRRNKFNDPQSQSMCFNLAMEHVKTFSKTFFPISQNRQEVINKAFN